MATTTEISRHDRVRPLRIRGLANRYTRTRIQHGLLHLVLIIFGIAMALPMVWVVSTSLKQEGTEFSFPPDFIPDPVVWSNYPDALSALPFGVFARNTVLIVVLTTIGALLTSSLAAYAFARLRFRGRDLLFGLCLSTLMVPYVVTLIPTFILFRELGWIDTLAPLIVPSWFGGGAFNIFLLRQFFLGLPFELDEAARVDGASALWLWWHVILPLSRTALATVAIFSIIFHWNDFLGPLIYLNSPEHFTLALGLNQFKGQYSTEYSLMMAASVVMMLPVLVIFFLGQRYFLKSIALTGLAGR